MGEKISVSYGAVELRSLGFASRDQFQYLFVVSLDLQVSAGRAVYLRLSTFVTTDFSQCLLVACGHVTMPLSEEANKVDLVCLTAVDRLEIIVTVDRVEPVIIGELLLGNCFLSLQAKDSVDVRFLLDLSKFPPCN